MTSASFSIKKAWDTTGDDMFSTVNDFYLSGRLPIGVINSSSITLGPQVAGAHNNLKRLQTYKSYRLSVQDHFKSGGQ